ncbi:MAG: TIR domain-containing protein [Vicinamibacterales bacterium]
MSAIFISHSSKDSALARAVEQRLSGQDFHSVFLDLDPAKGIVGGQSWERTLYRKLRACRAVIAICTAEYLRSHWCFAEIALARMEGKPVIGLLAGPLPADAALPAILTERQLIDLGRGEDDAYGRLWRALEALDLTGVATNWNPKEPPYLGLSAYQEDHAPVFFGREDEALAALELLDRGAPPVVLVLGASGSGKSSLVRAGVLPRLRAREDWLIVDPFRPGRDPWAELTESFGRAFDRYAPDHLDEAGRRRQLRERLSAAWTPPAAAEPEPAPDPAGERAPDERLRRLIEVLERVRQDPPPLTPRVRNYLEWSLDDLRRLSAGPAPPGETIAAPGTTPLVEAALDLRRLSRHRDARVLVVIDQFEELLGRDEPAVHDFLAMLHASVEAAHSPVTIVGTLRSDFLGLFQHHPALHGVDFESLSLGPMRADGMRRVVTMPARLAAIEIEDGLVDRLLADTGTPDALPMLSFTLSVMWRDRRGDEPLTLAAYERLGGLQGTIAREAEAVLATAVRERKEDALRRALLQMARLGDDGTYARRPVDWDHADIQRVHDLLTTLVDRRVLVTRLDGDRRIVEVAHEALFRAWTPLQAWLTNARSELLLAQQIERDAAAWHDAGRPGDVLWRGGRLLQAHELLRADDRRAGRADAPTAFVRAGMARRRWQRVLVTGAAVSVLAVLGAFLAFAVIQAARATREQVRALDIARVAVAGEWLPRDPTSAALVLLELQNPTATRFAPRRLGEALRRPLVRTELRHEHAVHSVALDTNGTRVVTTSGSSATVWDAVTGRAIRVLGHDEAVVAATIDPTGRLVAVRTGTVGEEYYRDAAGTAVHVWDLDAGTRRFSVTHADAVNGAAFAPDGRLVLTWGKDGTVQLWDAEGGVRRRTWTQGNDVRDATFNPAGTLVVAVTADGARVWSVDADLPIATLPTDRPIQTAAFNPDGTLLVTAGDGGLVTWAVDGWTRQHQLEAPFTRRVAFSADGRLLLGVSFDEVRVWDVAGGGPLVRDPIVHRGLVAAGFTADGSLVVTADGHEDRRAYGSPPAAGAVRFWRARSGDLLEERVLTFGSEVMHVAFGPRMESVAITSARRVGSGRPETFEEETVARLWDLSLGDHRTLWGAERADPVTTVAFSPDGRHVLNVAGRTAWLSDPATGAPTATLQHDADILSAVFDADGTVVVTASRDMTARVWDVATGRERFRALHDDAVEQALLVAGDRFLATRTSSTARLWTLASGVADRGSARFETPDGGDPTGRNDWRDDFSPDGGLMAPRHDQSVTIVDTATGKVLHTLVHGGYVRFTAFADGGRLLVTGGDEKVARVWDVASGTTRFTLEHGAQLTDLVLGPDGRTILSVDESGTGHLWDGTTGTHLAGLPHGCSARDGWFVADGSLVVTRSLGGGTLGCEANVTVWDAATGARRSSMPVSGDRPVGFNGGGTVMWEAMREVEAAQRDGIRTWDVDTGEPRLSEPYWTGTDVRTAAASPDGARVVTAAGPALTMWATGGALLQERLSAVTTACLSPEFRRQNLGESADAASRAHDACERRRGRR